MHAWRRASCVFAVASTAAVIVAGCGSSSDSSSSPKSSNNSAKTKDPVKVLAILDMTGPTKFLGIADKAGLDSAVKYLNDKGGIDGRHVDLEVVTDNGDPTTSVTTLVKYLASKGKPTFLFGGSYSSIAAALQPVASRNKLLSWSFGDGNNACLHNSSTNCGPFFSLGSQPVVQLTQAAEYFKAKGYKKVGIIDDQRDTSVTESEKLKTLLPEQGLTPVFASTPAKTVNVTPQMSKLKAAGVDVVFSEQIGPAVGYVLQARKKLGWKVPVVFDISGASSSITSVAAEDQWKDNTSMQIFSNTDPKNGSRFPGMQLMVDNNPAATQVKGGFGGQTINVASFPWDAMMLLNATISGTHSLDSVVNQKYMETHELDDPATRGLMTTHKYTADTHENLGWQPQDYSIVPVAPVDKTGRLIDSH
jgi:ABC-type branched-subunit amino acid transport system substrate-binding protein